MNCLIIDDDQNRHDCFEKHLTEAGHCVLHAFDAEEALEIFQTCQEPIGVALFDHDLGEGSKSGSALATDVLSLSKTKHPAMVFVISNNHAGALNIISKFQSAGILTEYRPFSEQMVQKLVKDLEPQ